MSWQSITQLASGVQSGTIKSTDLVKKSLNAIKENQQYQSIIVSMDDKAMKCAEEIDSRIARGELVGRLAGVPFIAKDNILVFGEDTTAASNILKGFQAPYQSTAIERLEAEGAICVAKANMDAFGHGASTENSDFMITKNPHDISRVPGGSSGGPASAVVLDLAPFALATDTGGSIRQPASFSGCVGYRPTYGLVSRSGVVAMASSFDTIGPLTSRVVDAELVLDVIAGKDVLDSTTIDREEGSYTDLNASEVSGTKFGVIKEYMTEGVDSEVSETIKNVADKLKQAGAHIEEISIPSLSLALACYYILVPAEISSNLSRYDGQRFGYSCEDVGNIDESYEKSRSTGFGNEAKRRIMTGTYVLSSGYYDAYYLKAQRLRSKLIEEFSIAFKQVDFLIGPVAPSTAFRVGENSQDPLKMYLVDVMTVAAGLAGIPGASLPVAVDSNNLPIGLQVMAAQRDDKKLLSISKQIMELV